MDGLDGHRWRRPPRLHRPGFDLPRGLAWVECSGPANVNGQPGIIGELGGIPTSALTLDIVNNRIEAIRIVVNPDKLGGLAR